MRTTVTYLFDPLCGWCYGASPVILQLGQPASIPWELVPTAVFLSESQRVLETLKVLQVGCQHRAYPERRRGA